MGGRDGGGAGAGGSYTKAQGGGSSGSAGDGGDGLEPGFLPTLVPAPSATAVGGGSASTTPADGGVSVDPQLVDVRPVSIMGLSQDGSKLYLSDASDDGGGLSRGNGFNETAGSEALAILNEEGFDGTQVFQARMVRGKTVSCLRCLTYSSRLLACEGTGTCCRTRAAGRFAGHDRRIAWRNG